MLSGLFKPAWQSNSVEKRLQAVENMDAQAAENQPILETLAKSDHERHVRTAALKKLTRPAVVFEIRQTHNDMATRADADLIFTNLIDANSVLSESEFRDLIKKHPESASYVAKFCPHADLRAELIQALPEPEQANLIASIEYSSTRVFIAEQLQSTEQLEHARKLLKGKDKKAEKILKSKIEKIHAKEKQEKENLELAERLCDTMEYLANHEEWRTDFYDRYLVCSQRWNALTFEPSEYVQTCYTKAYEKVRLGIEQRASINATYKAQAQLADEIKEQCKKVAKLSLIELKAEQEPQLGNLNTYIDQWKASTSKVSPKSEISRQFSLAQKSLESVLNFSASINTLNNTQATDENEQTDELASIKSVIGSLDTSLTSLNWPKSYPDLEVKNEIIAKLTELKTQANKIQKNASEKLDKLHKKISRIFASTKRGELGRAKRELAAVIKASEHYTEKDKAALDERIEKASLAVNKMSDWKDFATEPKYLELCEAMEVLADSKAHPDKLAAEISKLQKRWKALGHSSNADQHWERFKAAGDKAYEPCAAFFKQRHENRQKNLEKREPLLKDMQELLDTTHWEKAQDFKPIEVALRNITHAWQKVKDVEPAAGQKQWKKLTKVKSAIYEKLDVIYDGNIELKNELIAQAKALLESDIKEDTLKKLQFIQSKWKGVGITRRKQDQIAWKEFKTATDDVYGKIQGLRKTKRAEEDAHLSGYRNINKEIQKLAKTATELADADHIFERLQSEYKELPPLPRGLPEKLLNGIASDHKKACDSFNKTRERLIQNSKAQALNNLAKKAGLCTQLEALSNDATQEEVEALHTAIDELVIPANDLRKRFEKRLKLARDSNRLEYSEIRRLMCIDLEILLGVDSPSADQTLRTKIQLQRMQDGGFGLDKSDKERTLKKLKLDWYCLPGAEPSIQKELDERFSKLIQK